MKLNKQTKNMFCAHWDHVGCSIYQISTFLKLSRRKKLWSGRNEIVKICSNINPIQRVFELDMNDWQDAGIFFFPSKQFSLIPHDFFLRLFRYRFCGKRRIESLFSLIQKKIDSVKKILFFWTILYRNWNIFEMINLLKEIAALC